MAFIQWRQHHNRIMNQARVVCLFCALILTMSVLSAGAVDQGKISYTAESVCAFRSIGALDPDPNTRNPDYLAKYFVNPQMTNHFPGLGLTYEDAKIVMDRMNTGVLYWINARTHHLDTQLEQALRTGFRQVVIMGAGFDSRAYRFHEANPDVRFYEIDLPATSKEKQRRVESILGHRPDWVTYVPIDFNTQSLADVLTRAGFASEKKTFYMWEGVTYYISEAGVNSTLSFVAKQSAPGSQIVFDYMLEDVVLGLDYSPYGARHIVFMIANLGEPYLFGIDPLNLETFIHQHGLSLLSNLSPSELTQRYLIHGNGATSGRMAELMYIAHAEVPNASQRDQLRRNALTRIARTTVKWNPDRPQHVNLPDDVRAFLAAHSRNLMKKDFTAIQEQHSDKFLAYGHNKQQSLALLHRVYQNRPIFQYEIVLTRFEQRGNKAKIDGYAQRRGFRTPLMITDIIKENDGQWRWYGDQK